MTSAKDLETKAKEYSKVINEMLQTDIKWYKLDYEDIVELATLLKNPAILIKKLEVFIDEETTQKRSIGELSELLSLGAHVTKEAFKTWDGPLVSRAKQAYEKLKKGKD